MPSRNCFAVICLATVLCLGSAACKKRSLQTEPGQLKLAPPDQAFPGRSNLPVPAAAEAKGEKGPIRLTLRLLKTKLHQSESSLWVQVVLTNISDKRILVLDDAFNEGPQELRHYLDTGLYIEFLDGRGREDFWFQPEDHYPPKECWPDNFPAKKAAVDHSFWLEPGKSTATPAMAYQSLYDTWCEGKPRPQPIGDFGEIKGYVFLPGNYRVRAVFDHSGVVKRRRELGDIPDPDEIRVETPWIDVEATP